MESPPPSPSAPLDVTLKPLGCVGVLGGVLSLGFLPLYLHVYRRQLPARLTDEAMVLRNGTRIPWDRFTRARQTDVYYGSRRVFVGSRFQLWHAGGKVEFGTDKLTDPEAVVAFVLSHLPPEVLQPAS